MSALSVFRNFSQNKSVKFRLSALLFALLLVLFFTSDFSLLSVRQSALVVAIGIDNAEDGGVEVSLQIAVPEADDTAQKSHQETVSATAGTVSAAIRLCGQACGWYPVTTFCSLVILGEETVQTDVMEKVDLFLKDVKMQDAAFLAACEGKAKDVINSATPLDGVSSFAFEKIFSVNQTTVSTVNPISIKEFAEGYYSKGETAYMPYIRKVDIQNKSISFQRRPTPPKGVLYLPSFGTTEENAENPSTEAPEEEQSGGASGGSESSSGSSGGSSKESGESGGASEGASGSGKTTTPGGESETVGLYDASATLLFHKGRAVGILDAFQSLNKSLLLLSGKQGVLPVFGVKENGREEAYLLNVTKNHSRVKLTLKKGMPHLCLTMHLTAKTEDESGLSTRENASRKNLLPGPVKAAAEQQLAGHLRDMLSLCRETNCDLFGLHLQLYRRHPKHYERLKDRLYTELTVSYDIQVKGLK